MANFKISKKTITLISAIVLFIAGVLFCVSSYIGSKALTIILGIIVIILGILAVTHSLVSDKKLLSIEAMIGSTIIVVGITIITRELIYTIISLVPYIFLVLGVFVFADAFLLFFVRDRNKKVLFILQLIGGVLLIVLGILTLTVDFFKQLVTILLGVILIAIAIIIFVKIILENEKRKKK